jgi:hypothetical protein
MSSVHPFYEQEYCNFTRNCSDLLQTPLIFDMNSNLKLGYVSEQDLARKASGKDLRAHKKYTDYVHKGQRKLIMSELQHLTQVLDRFNEPAVVVYIGAAPSNKAFIPTMFLSNVKFLLVDPADFAIVFNNEETHLDRPGEQIAYFSSKSNVEYDYFSTNAKKQKFGRVPKQDPFLDASNYESLSKFFYESTNKIFINQQMMTGDSAEFIKYLFDARNKYSKYKNCKTILWSDVRSSASDNEPTDAEVLRDMMLSMYCAQLSKPNHSMFKFRHFYRGIDKVNTTLANSYIQKLENSIPNLNVKQALLAGFIPFYNGTIYNQCWRLSNSTETRLWVSGEAITSGSIKLYDNIAYEEINNHYNKIVRPCIAHVNPLAGQYGLDNCADCAIEGSILFNLKTKFRLSDESIKILVEDIGTMTRNRMNPRGCHNCRV